jgi:hypothetical protein
MLCQEFLFETGVREAIAQIFSPRFEIVGQGYIGVQR